jgi:hypothetical protein
VCVCVCMCVCFWHRKTLRIFGILRWYAVSFPAFTCVLSRIITVYLFQHKIANSRLFFFVVFFCINHSFLLAFFLLPNLPKASPNFMQLHCLRFSNVFILYVHLQNPRDKMQPLLMHHSTTTSIHSTRTTLTTRISTTILTQAVRRHSNEPMLIDHTGVLRQSTP